VWTFQNDVTFWFGMVLCDNESYPEGTKVCTPNSDANIRVPPGPDHAGAAFPELQFYPPGLEGFGSCDKTRWCAAMTTASVPGFRGGCAWALSNDLPNQISNFGGEQAAWGPLLVTNYGFDTASTTSPAHPRPTPAHNPPTLTC
jgi:hypothetical protein